MVLEPDDASMARMVEELRPLFADLEEVAATFTDDERAAIARYLNAVAERTRFRATAAGTESAAGTAHPVVRVPHQPFRVFGSHPRRSSRLRSAVAVDTTTRSPARAGAEGPGGPWSSLAVATTPWVVVTRPATVSAAPSTGLRRPK